MTVMMTLATIKDYIKTAIPDSLLTHRLPRQAGNSIVLTFDDGPDKTVTPQVLERLKKYQVRAVFFVIGRKIEESPSVFDMIVEHGHVIGNHTLNHPNKIITSSQEYQNELLKCADVISQRTGQTPHLVRPPLGLSLATLIITKRLKTKTLLWSIEGGEAGVHRDDDAYTIGNRLKGSLQPRDIILLHDNTPKVPIILDIILPHLKKRGIDLYNGISTLCPSR